MLLFTPGPTPIPESIRQAMAIPTLHHRTKEFEGYFEFCRIKLIELISSSATALSISIDAITACSASRLLGITLLLVLIILTSII